MGLIYTGQRTPEPSEEYTHCVVGGKRLRIWPYLKFGVYPNLRYIGTHEECVQYVKEKQDVQGNQI